MSVNVVNKSTGELIQVAGKPIQDASNINYDNTTSGLVSTKVQGAIDEVSSNLTDFEESITGEVSDNEPYVLRQGKGNLVALDLVGGSVAWNQNVANGNFEDTSGWTSTTDASVSAANNELTLVASTANMGTVIRWVSFITGHKYLVSADMKSTKENGHLLTIIHGSFSYYSTINSKSTSYQRYNLIFSANEGNGDAIRLDVSGNETNHYKNLCIFDLTQLFGSTIADAIYAMEQGTAGAGVELFRKLFPNDYYAYDAGSIQSVKAGSRKVYDADNNLIATYPFDISKELRGIPKIVNNKIVYDGDIYTSDGKITRKYGIVDLGTLTWQYDSSKLRFVGALTTAKPSDDDFVIQNLLSYEYVTMAFNPLYVDTSYNKVIAISNTSNISIRDTTYTDASTFKTAMSGVYLVYELDTPTTESAEPYQNPQRSVTDGTEEFTDYGVSSETRDMSIPVGHNSTYQLNETLPPIEDYVDNKIAVVDGEKQDKTDNSLDTTAKTVVGAVNELKSGSIKVYEVPYSDFTWDDDNKRFYCTPIEAPARNRIVGSSVMAENGAAVMGLYINTQGVYYVMGFLSVSSEPIDSNYRFKCSIYYI